MSPPWKSFVLATCMLAAITLPSKADDNEIKNGGFTQGMVGWDGECTLDGTRKITNRKAFDVVAEGTDGPDLKVLEVTLDPKEIGVISQKFRVSKKPGYLNVSFRYKASDDFKPLAPFPVYVAVAGAVNRDPAATWPGVVAGAPWKVFSGRYVMQLGQLFTLRISVRAGTGRVFLDDIKITYESAP